MKKEITATLTAIVYASQLITACGPTTLTLGEEGTGVSESGVSYPDPSYTLLDPETDGAGFAFGTTPFTHDVSLNGDATLTVPIFTPKGRAGVEPRLALTYSSGFGD